MSANNNGPNLHQRDLLQVLRAGEATYPAACEADAKPRTAADIFLTALTNGMEDKTNPMTGMPNMKINGMCTINPVPFTRHTITTFSGMIWDHPRLPGL